MTRTRGFLYIEWLWPAACHPLTSAAFLIRPFQFMGRSCPQQGSSSTVAFFSVASDRAKPCKEPTVSGHRMHPLQGPGYLSPGTVAARARDERSYHNGSESHLKAFLLSSGRARLIPTRRHGVIDMVFNCSLVDNTRTGAQSDLSGVLP
jgi:hypothetical protein